MNSISNQSLNIDGGRILKMKFLFKVKKTKVVTTKKKKGKRMRVRCCSSDLCLSPDCR